MLNPDLITKLVRDAFVRIRISSALNPMLWLSAIPSAICFIAASQFSSPLKNYLVYGGLCPIAVACFAAIYFVLFKPEKLQSEDYQIRKQALDLIEQKGGKIAMEATSVEAITNPKLSQLPDESDR